MMSIMTIFFNAHARVYARWTSLISMPVMQALVKKKKPSIPMPTKYRLLKKFQCPCPPGFTNGFEKKSPACLV
jgi:hypothetical protein